MLNRTTVFLTLTTLIACERHTSHPAQVSSSSTASNEPQAELDRLDGRAPVPLLPMMANHQKQNMRDHLVAVLEIVAGLARSDFAAIETAASRIGYSEQMGAMCAHMGAGASGFTEQATNFHRTADRIAEAARDKDQTRVIAELGATLQTCTACHAAWKQHVVDEATWQRLAGADVEGAAKAHEPHHHAP